MNSRQRVLAILNRQAVDRPAFDLGGTDCSSVHVVAYKKLRHFFKLPERPIRCGCLSQSIAEPDRDLLDALGADAERSGLARGRRSYGGRRLAWSWRCPRIFRLKTCPTALPLCETGRGPSMPAAPPTPITSIRPRRLWPK